MRPPPNARRDLVVDAVGDHADQSGDTPADGECELCDADVGTTVKYGLRVCPPCDDEYLP